MVKRASDAEHVIEATPVLVSQYSGRLLTLEIRAQQFGFTVFDGSKPIYWGACRYRANFTREDIVIRKIRLLMKHYAPSIVIARRSSAEPRRSVNTLVRRIATEVKRHHVLFKIQSRSRLKRFYEHYGCRTKHETAVLITKWFPDLAWKLPHKRKLWQSEPYNSLLFDAAAIAAITIIDG